eukprot:gene18051-biopygen13288
MEGSADAIRSLERSVDAEGSGNLDALVRSDSDAEAEREAAIRLTAQGNSGAGGRDEEAVSCRESTPPAAAIVLKQEPRQRAVSLLARNSRGFLPAVACSVPQRVSLWEAIQSRMWTLRSTYPDSGPADIPRSASSLCVKGLIPIFPFPLNGIPGAKKAKLSALIRWLVGRRGGRQEV